MKKIMMIVAIMLCASIVLANWDIARIAQNGNRLTIHITESPQKAHNFKITNVRGKEVGKLFGFKDKMLVFEGGWTQHSLNRFVGLYLDGDGQRRPLFKPVGGVVWADNSAEYVYPSAPKEGNRYVVSPPLMLKKGDGYVPRRGVGPDIVIERGTKTVVLDGNKTIVIRNGVPSTATVIRPDGTKVMGPALAQGPGPAPGEGEGPGKTPGEANAPGNGEGQGPGSGPGGPGEGIKPNSGVGPGQEFNSGPTLGVQPPGNKDKAPAFVMYVACGNSDEGTPGKVYQVNEHGRILGWVNLPSAPTGIALHRDKGLVVTLPRNGGKVIRIGDNGKWNTILEKQRDLVHPIDVGIAAGSDSILVADNISDTLMATTTGGTKPKVYERFEGQKWTAQNMSVAITSDKRGVWGDDSGIFYEKKQVLPGLGGVAADIATMKWAATQAPNQMYVLESTELSRKLRLPPGKSLYRQGMLSFGPASSLIVAANELGVARAKGTQPWFIMYDGETDEIRSLFQWEKEVVNDFVVGPRMFWDNTQNVAPSREIY